MTFALPSNLGKLSNSWGIEYGNSFGRKYSSSPPILSKASLRVAINEYLSFKNFYKDLPINRAEEFFVLQTGDPIGEDIGYIDPETNEERHVPLEIRIPDEKDTFYNQTFEDLGLYTETPTLPFATLGTLGWSHSNTAVDDLSLIHISEPTRPY